MVAVSQSEFPFELPHGFRDGDGTLHRGGVMRMSTAYDEIAPLKDARVQGNPGYLVIILLSPARPVPSASPCVRTDRARP